MCPSAVDGKLDLTLKAVGNLGELDLPNVVSDFGHLVCHISGIPSSAVEPVAFAVTNSEYGVILKTGDELNDLAGHIGVALNRIVNDSEGAFAGEVEGHVVAGLVAYPVSAVYYGLELYGVICLVNSVILGVGAVLSLGHGIGFICAVPLCAENLGGCARNDADVLSSFCGGFLGGLLYRCFGGLLYGSLGGLFNRSLGCFLCRRFEILNREVVNKLGKELLDEGDVVNGNFAVAVNIRSLEGIGSFFKNEALLLCKVTLNSSSVVDLYNAVAIQIAIHKRSRRVGVAVRSKRCNGSQTCEAC